MINRRLEEGEDFRWIVPVDYVTNLVDFRDSFILNKTSSKYSKGSIISEILKIQFPF